MAEILHVKHEENVEDPKHAEEMIAKAEGKETSPTTTTEEEGKLFANKYKTEEDLQKGTLELLKKKGNLEDFYKSLESEVLGNKEPEEEVEEEPTPTEVDEQEIKDLEKQKDESPVDFSEYEKEFFEKGELSEDTYKELEEKGFNKQIIDRYIEGVQALAEKQAAVVFESVGGKDQYDEMIAWAADNLTEKEKQIFNKGTQTADIDEAKFAVEALYGKYMRAKGSAPRPIQGKAPAASKGQRFESRQEVVEAMSNPKYEKDPAYRAEVERKLAISDVF